MYCRSLSGCWHHLFGPHLDTAGLLEDAQELNSRDELLRLAAVEPDLPHEVEEAHLEEMEAAYDVLDRTPSHDTFSRHFHPCAHITVWLKVSHDVSA